MRYRFSAYYAMGIESVLFYPKLGFFGGYRDIFLVLKGFLVSDREDMVRSPMPMI